MTHAPAKQAPTLLFDGECRLCSAQAATAGRLAAGKVVVMPLQLGPDLVPEVSEAEARHELKLVDDEGVHGGAEAIIRLIRHGRPLIGAVLLRLYRLPGAAWLVDNTYAWVARNRYRLFGRSGEQEQIKPG